MVQQLTPKGPWRCQKGAKMYSSSPRKLTDDQYGLKMDSGGGGKGPRKTKMVPRSPQDRPDELKAGPMEAQEASKTPQMSPT